MPSFYAEGIPLKNFPTNHRPAPSPHREPIRLPRPIRSPTIVLQGQCHLVEIRDSRDDTTRQYVIETTRNTSNHYGYVLIYRSKWDKSEQHIHTGAQFDSSDSALDDAMMKIDAWERWLEASRSNDV